MVVRNRGEGSSKPSPFRGIVDRSSGLIYIAHSTMLSLAPSNGRVIEFKPLISPLHGIIAQTAGVTSRDDCNVYVFLT